MRYFKLFRSFLKDFYDNRYIIWQLTKRDYKNAYIGSFLGTVWSIIQPIVMIFVLWFVFSYGFRSRNSIHDIPFIAYLTVGMSVWNFFSQAFTSTAKVFNSYSYLVKKLNFKVAVLPVVKIFSALMTHLIFLVVAMVIIIVSGVAPSFYWIQFLYYLFALLMLLLALGWIVSSFQVFVKDTSQVIRVILRFGFWFTPIFWNFDTLPVKYQNILKLNPIYYIVHGYRQSFLYGEPFWTDVNGMIVYWGIVLVFLILSIVIFSRLRPHFSDVL